MRCMTWVGSIGGICRVGRQALVELGRTACRIAGIHDLIAMKQQAGRPQDLRDIDELRRILALSGLEDS